MSSKFEMILIKKNKAEFYAKGVHIEKLHLNC